MLKDKNIAYLWTMEVVLRVYWADDPFKQDSTWKNFLYNTTLHSRLKGDNTILYKATYKKIWTCNSNALCVKLLVDGEFSLRGVIKDWILKDSRKPRSRFWIQILWK